MHRLGLHCLSLYRTRLLGQGSDSPRSRYGRYLKPFSGAMVFCTCTCKSTTRISLEKSLGKVNYRFCCLVLDVQADLVDLWLPYIGGWMRCFSRRLLGLCPVWSCLFSLFFLYAFLLRAFHGLLAHRAATGKRLMPPLPQLKHFLTGLLQSP